MILLSIDPGVRGCGCALWDGPQLLRATYVINEAADGHKVDLFERARAMGTSVARWVQFPDAIDRVVIELPQTYGGRAAQGDANDLISVAVVVGALTATFPLSVLSCVVPHEWKGNIPKPKHKKDYDADGYVIEQRVRAELDLDESVKVQWPSKGSWKLQMDVADGIGIGLWALKKGKVRR